MSLYRTVFTDATLRAQFGDFLDTVFLQADKNKVLAQMTSILEENPNSSDEAIYKAFSANIAEIKKNYALFHALEALHTVKTGVSKQSATLLAPFRKDAFSTCVEIFNHRYCLALEKEAKLSFLEKIAVTDAMPTGLKDHTEMGSITIPYHKWLPLNEANCQKPTLETERTYAALSDEIAEDSVDLMACLGGLHHVPQEKLDAFATSLYHKSKMGGVLLLREHDCQNQNVAVLASVIHSFVNAFDGLSWEEEKAEVRNFQSATTWTKLLEEKGFQRLRGNKNLILEKDPSANGVMAFVKAPKTKEDVEKVAFYEENYMRSAVGSYATWIEWGNLRFAGEYKDFIQERHSYEFDFLGHMQQHWAHFYHASKESLSVGLPAKEVLFTDNLAMNLFIVLGTTMQLGFGWLTALPSRAYAGLFGHPDFSALEKWERKYQEAYCAFIETNPFFAFDYWTQIKSMWKEILSSGQSPLTQLLDILGAMGFTINLGLVGIASAFIQYIHYSDEVAGPGDLAICVLVDDPNDCIGQAITDFATWKTENSKYGDCNIEVLYEADGRKCLSLPFYRPFRFACEILAKNDIPLVKVGAQDTITFDLIHKKGEPDLTFARSIYTLDKLQDPEERRYTTYEIEVTQLHQLFQSHKDSIVYLHEHRGQLEPSLAKAMTAKKIS